MPAKEIPELEARLKAINAFTRLSATRINDNDVENEMIALGVSKGIVRKWRNRLKVTGVAPGKVARIPELLYVIGSLLGDGCPYQWKTTFSVLLVGEEAFARKFASKLSLCVGYQIHWHKAARRNFWYVRILNPELFHIFLSTRVDPSLLEGLLNEVGRVRGIEEFVQGFFDAEGCVKVIREKTRRTPKICVDFTNTDLRVLTLVKGYIEERLGIVGRFSTQRARPPRKECFHLRLYSKANVAIFLGAIPTVKLTEEKIIYVDRWLRKGLNGKILAYDLPKSGVYV